MTEVKISDFLLFIIVDYCSQTHLLLSLPFSRSTHTPSPTHMHTLTVRGAHPQHYHEFMTVLCGYIVEKQREWQGEEIPQELVYVSERGGREGRGNVTERGGGGGGGNTPGVVLCE